jgi:hypothetical protein
MMFTSKSSIGFGADMPLLKNCPADLDLCLYLGDANVFGVELLAAGDPVDATGWTITSQIRLSATDPTVVLEATVTEVDAANGQFLVAFDGEAARAVVGMEDGWQGVWDLQADTSLGVKTYVAGNVTFTQDVTRTVTP